MDWPDQAELPDHDQRLRAARTAARWYLGDKGWADLIIGYYTDPTSAMRVLDADQDL